MITAIRSVDTAVTSQLPFAAVRTFKILETFKYTVQYC